MAQITSINLPDGRTLVPGDWTSAEPLYSTVEFGTGAQVTLRAFSYGLNGSVPGSVGLRKSNLSDTNLEGEGGVLPENEELVIYNLMIELYGVNTDTVAQSSSPYTNPDPATSVPVPDWPFLSLLDVLRVQRDVLIVTNIAAIKEYTRQPLGYFPATTGVQQVNSAGASSVVSAGKTVGWIVGENGSVDAGGQRTFASPLYVAGGESFNVEFRFPTGQVTNLNLVTNGRVRARVLLDGFRKRPVA